MSVKVAKSPSSAATRKDVVKDLLDNVLNFGPDESSEVNTAERLKKLVKQLEDLNARIKKLSNSHL
jgi:hypothetical protein